MTLEGMNQPYRLVRSELRDLACATTLKAQLKTPKLTAGRTSITSRDRFVLECSGLTELFLFEHC